jgi:hypothetical protein
MMSGVDKVVEQHHVRACLERGIDFAQALRFDLDGRFRFAARMRCTALTTPGETYVVVLDQNSVVESEPVVGAHRRAHGVSSPATRISGVVLRVSRT